MLHPRFLRVASSILLFSPAQAQSWIEVPLTVVENITDDDYTDTRIELELGNPPQKVYPTLNLAVARLVSWSNDCVFCAGTQLFDPLYSSTFKEDKPWNGSSIAQYSGRIVRDTVGFGGSDLGIDSQILLIDGMSTNMTDREIGGIFGTTVNLTSDTKHVFSNLWESGKLLNPVIGIRADPKRQKMTIGALDPADYEGVINWVEISPTPSVEYPNQFDIDGVKGYNGSFVPFSDAGLTAVLDASARSIFVPPNNPYPMDHNYTGPIKTINLYPANDSRSIPGFAYKCDEASGDMPYVALTVTINGVDYPLDSRNNLLHPASIVSAEGFCNVGILNITEPTVTGISFVLGQPFLRSVYVAYRFPTDSCPGYWGFAFPSGANRTEAQINQVPRSTPTQSSQCLSLVAPTSTPSPVAASQFGRDAFLQGSYPVYGDGDGLRVGLVGSHRL